MTQIIPFSERNIEYLKGVGPQRAELLRSELQIRNFGELLFHFPFRYVDRSKIYQIREIEESMPFVQIKGKIGNIRKEGAGRTQRLVASVSDGTGHLELVWFQGIKWIAEGLKPGTEYIVFGKPTIFRNVYNITHPELSKPGEQDAAPGIQPVYSITEKLRARGLDVKNLAKLTGNLVKHPDFHLNENLPAHLLKNLHLMGRADAFRNIHFPGDLNLAAEATRRLKFEEMFFMQLKLLKMKIRTWSLSTNIRFSQVGNYFNHFYHHLLPFELTGAQKRVIKEIRSDMNTGHQMNRLLQGDVGSGKTIVALLSMLIAADNGFQACIMAPTEILAQQHYENIKQLLRDSELECDLLTGSTPAAKRKTLLKGVAEGSIHFLIGTHALIEDQVKFHKLGLAIIDEQHRFGVAQRYSLWQKNEQPPHVLVMTATPIPRTLAMTVYGDLEISVIDELPSGRKPIRTVHRYEKGTNELYTFMKEQIALGRQVYIVYPLIEESEKLDLQNLGEGFELAKHHFPEPNYLIGMLHGRMKAAEKDVVMKGFVSGETNVLVSTTVIEVGVNVPNASVMVVMNAERFGLAQLHQLRGRVGRGADQSYCILVTSEKLSSDGRKRIQTMVESTDGFRIAEVDMELRGPGDLEGTRQSGLLDLKLVNIATDTAIIETARKAAEDILSADPDLKAADHQVIANFYQEYKSRHHDWSRVS